MVFDLRDDGFIEYAVDSAISRSNKLYGNTNKLTLKSIYRSVISHSALLYCTI